MTDGTLHSAGSSLTAIHRWVRRIVLGGSQAFIGACRGSFALFERYGVPRERMFQSHLCADNAAFLAAPPEPKQYDLLFSGRFVPIKNPLFALDVAGQVALQLGRQVSIAFLGAGELEPAMRARAEALGSQVDAHFPGFVQPQDLPKHYKRARVFLFPTSWDAWGVVANEASVAGVPIVVTPMAGAAGEIVQDDVNGFVLSLDVEQWSRVVCRLLTDEVLYERMSLAGPTMAAPYTYQHAAEGVSHAVHAAVLRKAGG
jgi:glycosyltransferase involved in cell wall biosynthesis